MTTLKDGLARGLAVVAIVIAIISCLVGFAGRSGPAAGTILDTSYFDSFQATTGFNLGSLVVLNSSGLQINSSSTRIARINAGTCYIQPYATTIAASSTAYVDCQAKAAVGSTTSTLSNDTPLTGVTYGDAVDANFATTSASTLFGGISVISAAASGTTGFIQLQVANGTGATFTWPTTGIASGTVYYIVTH